MAGNPALAVREMLASDIDRIVGYFVEATPEFLEGMGVDPTLLPPRDEWVEFLAAEMAKPLRERPLHYLVWEADGEAIGHSNINKVAFGREAFMHLHIWDAAWRGRGLGTALVTESARRFCELFELKVLYCEPYALNEAPNRTLAAAGFEFVEEYETTPGWINFEQPVRRWRFGCG